MKNNNTFLKIAVSLVLTALVFAGCFIEPPVNNSGGNDLAPGMGAVYLDIAGSESRTIFPVLTDVTYSVTCSSGADTVTSDKTNVELKPGTWDITVEAEKDEAVIGSASVSGVLVELGKTTAVEVLLIPAGTENGTLSWTITAPEGLDSQSLEYSSDGADWTGLTPFDQGTEDLAAGSYLVRSSLTGSGGSAGDIEAFHIYPGLITVLDWSYSADALISTVPFAGSVSIAYNDTLTGIVKVSWDLTADGGMEPRALDLTYDTVNGIWEFSTDIPNTVTLLGGALTITTENNSAPLSYPYEDIPYSASIILDPVTIYTLSASVGANGTLNVNSAALADSGKRDFLDGTEIILTVTPSSNYEIDVLQASGLDYTAPFEITSDTTVTATFKEKEGVDPNLIFEWQYGDDNGPKGTFTNSSDTAYLVGTGSHGNAAAMPVRTTNASVTDDTTNKGIKLDGYNFTSGSALLIGTNENGATTSGTVATSQPAGVFDFRTGNNGGIKVSIGMEILTDATGNRGFNVILNNSTTTAGNSPLNIGSGNEARIAYWAAPLEAGTGVTGGASYNATSKILTCATILPDNYNQGIEQLATLEEAFISLMTLGDNGTIKGAEMLIKSIRIEYIPETPPPEDLNLIFEWQYGDDNGPKGTFTNSGTDAYLVGTGTHGSASAMPVRITTGSDITDDTVNKGIKIDGYNATGGRALLIGTNDNGATTSGTVAPTQPVGVFDFRTGNTGGIKVSIVMEILTDGVGGRGFNVILNNSTTTANATPLDNGGNEARIAYWATPIASGTGVTGGASYNVDSKTLTCATILPNNYNQGPEQLATLEEAFISLMTLGVSGGNSGAEMLIKSIRIEYVE